MKAVLDHVGIAVGDLPAAIAFYHDALGLQIEVVAGTAPQDSGTHVVPVSEAKIELLEATTPESPEVEALERRNLGLHHLTLRVEDIAVAVADLKARGVRFVDAGPWLGAEGALVASIHPSSANGVLVTLKQQPSWPRVTSHEPRVTRYAVGDIELISLSDGLLHLDGGSMFGVVPKALWSARTPADPGNRIGLAMRPLVVRGTRTMIIDAGLGDKEDDKFLDTYGVDRARNLDHALVEAGLCEDDIDIVLATHLHFDHAGGFTVRDPAGHVRPRFPRAQYVVRRGEWEDATHPNERNRASYRADNYVPLAEAGVLQLVDDDQFIMPGVRVSRTGGHTAHHQIVVVESGGQAAAFVADLIPTTAHLPAPWIMGYDLYPLETLASKKAFVQEAVERHILVFFEHDLVTPAGYIHRQDGKATVTPVASL
jgi:methylmalonyl-CoA epimerase